MGSALLQAVAVLGALALAAYVLAAMDRLLGLRLAGKDLSGALLEPLAGGLRLMGREDVVPEMVDRQLYPLGPVYFFAAVFVAFTIIPLAPGWIAADLSTGILFFQAVVIQAAVALLMGGWGANSRGGLGGAMRFVGQLVAYAIPFALTTVTAGMVAGSLKTTAVVESQAALTWNIILQPLGFVVFFVSMFAVGFWSPFDLADTGTELAGGVAGEYTGPRLALFRLAHLALILSLASFTVVVFLGGWLGPLLPPALWFVIKLLLVLAAMVWVRHRMLRVRIDQLMAAAWKILIPLALVNVAWVGILLLLVGR
ncbi:MAG: complex I subunit 1 family protein [Rubrobacteraceae bacterium]